MSTRKSTKKANALKAIAVFKGPVEGEVVITDVKGGVRINAFFTKLPKGKHGFHIHKAGDLRGEGCKGLCEHYDLGKHTHGGYHSRMKHTGDLGNIELRKGGCRKRYTVKKTSVRELWGRSLIVHADEDDCGLGNHPDSLTTGNSGKRIACAIIGYAKPK
jgi:Cu-Zn family superoxide dismutase